MWIEIAVSSAVLCTRWMSPGGAKPLTSPTWLSLRPIRLRSASKRLLVLNALDDGERAPGDVVVDPGDLPGPPDQRDDRERSVGLDMQRVTAVVVRRPEPLLGGQDLRGGQMPAQLVGDELRGLVPAGMALDGG